MFEQVLYADHLVNAKKLPSYKNLSNDQIVLNALREVINRIDYEIDSKRFGVVEKWQTLEETLTFRKGDCEDGAILIYALARANGISPGQLRLSCGFVNVNGKKEGHCWLEYMPDSSFGKNTLGQWYTIDWCYWPDDREFGKRTPKNTENYLSTWWSISDFFGWKK